MKTEYKYSLTVRWTGNTGSGATSYRSYERAHDIRIQGKPDIEGTSDPSFRGDKSKHNPEERCYRHCRAATCSPTCIYAQ